MSNRYIPKPQINDNIKIPRYYNFIKQLSGEEKTLVDSLVKDFTSTGVLDRNNNPLEGVRDLHGLVASVAKSAVSEDAFLPDLYAENVDNELGTDNDNAKTDWVNPSLDGIGDLGEQYYPNNITEI